MKPKTNYSRKADYYRITSFGQKCTIWLLYATFIAYKKLSVGWSLFVRYVAIFLEKNNIQYKIILQF